MSFYDDASLVFLAAGAAGKDGKAYSLKPTDGSGDFTFTRGTNLTATRVGKDGYIEKGNEQLARNTTWADVGLNTAPTGWTDYRLNGGTYDATSVSGQIQFVTTSTQRAFLISQNFNTISNYVLSVTVDEVNTAFKVSEFLGVSANADEVTYFKDGAVISYTTNIEAGSRYSLFVHKDNTSTTTFRIGIGANTNTEGDITVSKPQITYGLAPVDYVENTSTSSSKSFGLLEDEPRFDYTGGGCPALLMEPTRTNLVTDSEYFSSWLNTPDVTIEYGYAAPDGTNSAAKITETGSNAHIADNFGSTIVTGVYKSIWARTVSGTGTVSLLNQYAEGSVTLTEEWQRFEAAQSGPAFMYAVDFRSAANTLTEVLIWGAQAEVGSYPTSYIPTYGSAATRSKEGASDSYDYMNLSATNLYSSTSYTYFLDINLPYDVGTSGSLWKDNDNLSTNGGFQLRKTSDAGTHVGITTHDGSSYEAFSTNVLTGRLKLAIVYNNGEVSVYYNGVESAESPMTVTGWDQSTNHFKFEDGGNGTYEVQQFLYIPTALSNNDCEILTGTSYTSFASMATSSALNYTIYE